jgi:hypothetical protein
LSVDLYTSFMKNRLLCCCAFLAILIQPNCQNTQKHTTTSTKIKGLSFVAPREPFKNAPMMDVKAVNAAWIAVIPYGFTRQGEPSVRYEGKGRQHWGEQYEGVITTIDSAHRAGLNVMLKPQIFVGNSWTGGLDFATDKDWALWEKDYEKYLLPFVHIADSMQVKLVCIGTEFKISVQKRPQFWHNLIVKIRKQYKGQLVYAANWDEYDLVTFWKDLDYIGVDAYFSLVAKATPSVSELELAWKPYFEQLRNVYKKEKKPILFTEFGYMPIDSCTYKSWEIEKRRRNMSINEEAQANAIDALFTVFWKEPWWAGGFLWKWFPDLRKDSPNQSKDYTPQGRKGAVVLAKWYAK